MRMYSTLDSIFSGKEIVFDDEDAVYRCPVCKKEYKREVSAKKHLAARRCASVQDAVRGFPIENIMYEVYKIFFDASRSTLTDFRKSKLYDPVATFCAFCIDNDIESTAYATFVKTAHPSHEPFVLINAVLTSEDATRYRIFLINHPDLIDSASYIEAHRNELNSLRDFVHAMAAAKITWDGMKQAFPVDALNAIYHRAAFADRLMFDSFISSTGQHHGLH